MTKVIDWNIVDSMLEAGSDGTECASVLGIHYLTLYRHCEDEKKVKFDVYKQQKKESGDARIREAQFIAAMKDKNPTMLVWLGKVRLNQRENDSGMDKKDVQLILDEIKASRQTPQ